MSIDAVAARMSAGECARFDATSTTFVIRSRERLSKWSMIAWRFEPRPEASTASRDGIPRFYAAPCLSVRPKKHLDSLSERCRAFDPILLRFAAIFVRSHVGRDHNSAAAKLSRGDHIAPSISDVRHVVRVELEVANRGLEHLGRGLPA